MKKVLILSIHPAPYRDPVFSVFFNRWKSRYHIMFLQLYGHDSGHAYQEKGTYAYPYFVLKEKKLFHKFSWHPEIRAILKENRFDTIVVPGYSCLTTLYAIVICFFKKTSLVFSGDMVPFNQTKGIKQMIKRVWLRWLFKSMSAAWVPGRASRHFLQSFNTPEDKIYEGAYCLDAEYLSSQQKKNTAELKGMRERLGFLESDYIFMFAGRMIPVRGLDILIRAFEQLRSRHEDAKLLLIGEGSEKTGILNYVKDHHVRGVVILAPAPISSIGLYYALSDCYVLPSLMETYSLALAHAGICRLPMIVTDHVGAADDFVEPQKNGLIVKAGCIPELHQAMEEMLTNRHNQAAMGEYSFNLAIGRNKEWAAGELQKAVERALG